MLKFIVLLFFILSYLGASTKDVTLLLSWKHQFQFAGYYAAIEKGYYKELGLNVTIKEFDLNRNISKEVVNGNAEFGIGHSAIILEKLNTYPQIILLNAINQSAPLILLSKKRKDLQKLEDIIGKKIMLSNDQTLTASIDAMLYSAHLEPSQYKSVQTSFDPIVLIRDEVDLMVAYSSNEPYVLKQKGIDFTIFDPKDYGYDFYSDILFTSQDMVKNDPNTVKNFRNASLKGWEYAYSHTPEIIDLILKKYNTQSRTKQALLFESKVLRKLAFKDNIHFGDINPIKIKEIVNTYRLLGLINNSSKIDFNSFVYQSDNTYKFSKITQAEKDSFIYNFVNSLWFRIILLVILIILSLSIFFKLRMDKILREKTDEIEYKNKIFDTNIASSVTDTNGNISYVSEAFCELSGYTKSELVGQNSRILQSINTTKEIYKDLWITILSGNTWIGELQNTKKDGTIYWIKTIISPIISKNGKINGFESILQNITLKKVLENFNEKLQSEVLLQTQELTKNEQFLDTLFDVNPNISYVVQGDIVERVNKAYLEFVGFDTLEEFLVLHKCICHLFEENKNPDQHYENEYQTGHHVTIIQKKRKTIFRINAKEFTVNEQERHLVILEDITEIQTLAITDKLTGAFNRVKIDKDILSCYKYYQDFKENFSIILLDIDHFKEVNDNHGHLIGDEILKEVTHCIRESIRATDILGRWGGEEFMVICPNTEESKAYNVAQSIRKKIESCSFPRIQNITISGGVTDITKHVDTSTLINSADKALYQAKNAGRNKIVGFKDA